MRFSRRQWTRWGAAALTSLAAIAPASYAQKPEEEKLPPYDVTGLKHSKQWLPWVFAFGFATLALLVAFKNPHRSHLD